MMNRTAAQSLNIAMVVATLAFVGIAIVKITSSPKMIEPLKVGDRVEGLDRGMMTRADATLFVVVQDGCRYCAESVPFYRTLTARRLAGTQTHVRMVAVVLGERDQATAARHVAEHGLAVDDVVALHGSKQSQLRVAGTPTLFMTSRAGIVTDAWIGKLSPSAEAQVLSRISPGKS